MAHTDLTVNGATSAGRWTSRLVPFAAVALITAQLVVARAKASTHSHLHITPSERQHMHSALQNVRLAWQVRLGAIGLIFLLVAIVAPPSPLSPPSPRRAQPCQASRSCVSEPEPPLTALNHSQAAAAP